MITLNSLFIVGSFFNAEGSEYDSIDSEARILVNEGAYACFTFKVDDLLCAEGLGELK